MVKVVEPDKIPITSINQLLLEFSTLQLNFDKDETEHTWEQIDKALKRFHAVVRGGACKFIDEFIKSFKSKDIVTGMIRSMATERTRLSATTLDLLASITRLGPSFAPLLPYYLPPLLKLLCRTNKLYISRAQSTLSSILSHTHLVDILKYIVSEWKAESGKSTSFRIGVSELLLAVLLAVKNEEIEKESMEKRIIELEWIIKTGATDREAKVRGEIKKSWEIYKVQWPERVATFTGPMTPVIRRYLNVTAGATSQPIQRPTVIESRATTAPNLHRTVITSTLPPSLTTVKREPAPSKERSKSSTFATSNPTNKESISHRSVTTEGAKSSKTSTSTTSSKESRDINPPMPSTSRSNHAPPSPPTRTSRPTASSSSSSSTLSSRPGFKPANSLSRSLGNNIAGVPTEQKKARRYIPPNMNLPSSVLPGGETDLPHSNLSRSTGGLASSTSSSTSSSTTHSNPINNNKRPPFSTTSSTIATTTTTPFRPQPPTIPPKKSSSTSTISLNPIKAKPSMAGRAISTTNHNQLSTVASAQRVLKTSTRSGTSSSSTSSSGRSIVVGANSKKKPEEIPLPLTPPKEDQELSSAIKIEEVVVETENGREEEEEEEELLPEVSPSFDRQLEELVKVTTEVEEEDEEKENVINDNLSGEVVEVKKSQQGTILDQMFELEKEEEEKIAVIVEVEVEEVVKDVEKSEDVEKEVEEEVVVIPMQEDIVSDEELVGVKEEAAMEETEESNVVEVVEQVRMELEADKEVEVEKIEEVAVEEVSIDEEIILPEVQQQLQDISLAVEDISIISSTSTSFNSESTSSYISISSPQASTNLFTSTPNPNRQLPTLSPITTPQTLTNSSSPILSPSVHNISPVFNSTLSPSAFHTTSFLFDTPLKANTLPVVRFPKVQLVPSATKNILTESSGTSISSNLTYTPLDVEVEEESTLGDENVDEEVDEEEEDEESILEEGGGSESFCVPLNDISRFEDEDTLSEASTQDGANNSSTRFETSESDSDQVIFNHSHSITSPLEGKFSKGSDLDETVIIERSLRSSRNRSRSRGRIDRSV